ncbi:uncharacterized protein LOC130788740 [Actinidia eriantha]|uniref:uncharacterized protein LOC130788740 n=1 Tax=Actinidia eriantha TaxID=165200 RepID=UPI00258F5EF0|nr:uncharacterized protein LOC130788740 [Actinidia eriantha]
MQRFGFPVLWIKWMKACVTTADISMLINGSTIELFSSSKGLRQGDPLFPFLFILAVEGLNIMFKRAIELGLTQWKLQISKRILRCFEVMSGLKINYNKSILWGVGVDRDCMKNFAYILKCEAKSLPIQYLGLSLGANPGPKPTWKPILDRIRARLASWKKEIPGGVAKEIDMIQSRLLGVAVKQKTTALGKM